jgi:tRNA(Ile)-lysidine synthase
MIAAHGTRTMAAETAISPAEAAALFRDLRSLPAVLLAVSGGPDSTALLWLAARWRAGLAHGPKLVAATVDHGLRPDAAKEARAVAKLARKLGIEHRTLRWTGRKPRTGLQEAAREARYSLLAKAARMAGAPAIATAHTLDDQAETVLIRMMRGSGLAGLGGMRRISSLPTGARGAPPQEKGRPSARVQLIRPFLSVAKSRLIATLRTEGLPFADDPSNHDPRFTRARLRKLTPVLAGEGLDARRLVLLATRLARAEAALDETARRTYEQLAEHEKIGRIVLATADFMALSEEIRLRLLGRAIGEAGDEGPVELGKLEALHGALAVAHQVSPAVRFRRSLAGAVVTLNGQRLTVERAPPRRGGALTRDRSKPAARSKAR